MDRHNPEPLQLDLCRGHLCSYIHPQVLAGVRKSKPIKMPHPYLFLLDASGYKTNMTFCKFYGQINRNWGGGQNLLGI